MEFMCGPGTTIKQSTNPDYAYYYDADDYARDQADYMASNGIVAYVVGLGPFVSGLNEDGTPFRIPGHECDHPLNADSSLSDACPDTRPARDPAGAERLLRYIADMGFDPAKKLEGKAWPCNSDYWNGKPKLPTGQHCGNYWYGAAGVELPRVFEAVDSHIMGGFRVYLPVVTKEG
jgi:hypothetical protein